MTLTIREPMLPAVIEPKVVKTPWWKSKRIEVVYQPNVMVVYRVVPHANVDGDTKRMWRALHKMYEMYASPRSRFEREGLRFSYREKDVLWFDIVFRKVGGERKVEFYVGTSEFQAQKLKRRLENMMHVTLKDAEIKDLEVPEDNTLVQEMRYMRHNIFSLATNTKKRETPIGTILSTVDELTHDGDFARLSICADHESRRRWAKTAQFAHENLKEGKVPQRTTIKAAGPMLKGGLAGLINGVNSAIQDVMDAIHSSFFAPDKPSDRRDIIEGYSLLDELHATKLSDPTREKRNLPVFKTHHRVVAHSSDKLTCDTILETLSAGAGDTAENNELVGVPVRGKAAKRVIGELNTLKLTPATRNDTNVNLVSTDEMAKLALQLPARDMQMRYADELDAKYRIEAEVPAALRTGEGIPFGTAQIKDRAIAVDMPVANPDELYIGYTFIGRQGSGKDTALKNWIIDANMRHGISAIVIDAINEPGERGLADGIRDGLPADRIIDINLADDDYVVPLDLTEVIASLGRLGADRFADEVIDLLDIENLTQARSILQTAAKASGGSLVNIKRIIEDEEFRGKVADYLVDSGEDIRTGKDLRRWGDNEALGTKADPILNRLDRYFGNSRLRDIFSQPPHPDVDFARWMAEGKVVILRVPNRVLGDVATRTLVHWITLKAYMTRKLMAKQAQSAGTFIVFNEPEQYASEGLTRLMGRIGTEGRKERLSGLYAFHHWNKLPKSLQENLLGGGVQQFLFANNHEKTFELSRARFEDQIPMEQAIRLPLHYAIVSLQADGEMQPAFIAKMNPPAKARYNNARLTQEHAKRFGRHWRDLQAEY